MARHALRSGRMVIVARHEQSAERIHAEHPDVSRGWIETHVVGWLESCAPATYPESQIEELDQLIEPWLDDYERRSRAARK